jgi:hypothetical protein
VLQAHRELFEMYKYRCRPLDAAAEDEYHHSRAVMHVNCCRAEAVVLICLPGNAAADAMATEVGYSQNGNGSSDMRQAFSANSTWPRAHELCCKHLP